MHAPDHCQPDVNDTAMARSRTQRTTRIDRLAQAELLMTIATSAATEDSLERILSTALRHLSTAIPFTGGSIALVEGDELVIRAARGRFAAEALGRRIARNNGPSWRVVETGEPFLSADVIAAGRRPTSPFRSFLAVPLRWRDQIFGLLEIDSTAVGAFSHDDLPLLQNVAAALSGPIAQARQLHELKREIAERIHAQRRLAAQYRVTRILAEAPTFSDVMSQILATIGDYLAWHVGAIWCIDHDYEVLRCSCFWRAPDVTLTEFEELTRQIAFVRGEGLPGRVWEHHAPVWISDIADDHNFPRLKVAARVGLRSAFAFPIQGRLGLFGVVEFLSREPRPFDKSLVETTAALGAQMGQFIDRRRAELARHQSEEHKGAILQTALDAIISIDHRGQITEFNAAAERIFGYRRGDVLGRDMADLIVPPALRARHRQGLRRFLASGESHMLGRRVELTAMRADGSEFPIELAITQIPSTDTSQFTAFIRDITERRRAEEAQRILVEAGTVLASSLDFHQTLASLVQLIVPRLADWCLIDLLESDGSLRQTAVAHVDPKKAQLARDLRRRYPPDPDEPHVIWRVLRSGRAEYLSAIPDLALVSRDRRTYDLLRQLGTESHMVVPLIARGRTIGVISLIAGPSGRRYHADDLALAEELARRAALAIDNGRLYHEAQAAIELRDEFLSIASHELKTPLTTLLGHTQALRRRLQRAQTLSERDQRAIRVIEEQALRLNKQIATLLDVSRLQMGQFYMDRQPVDLCALIRRVGEEIEPTLEQHVLQISCPDDPVIACGDEQRLEQVLQNLLQNAIKYSPAGGHIWISLARQGTTALLTVQDEGIGVPEAARERLFQRFYRASNVAEQRIAGLGLGLYMVSEIITRHGGSVSVRSVEGVGSTFEIRLPLLNGRPCSSDDHDDQAP